MATPAPVTALGAVQVAEPLEYQLATLTANGYVSKDHITVARLRNLLSPLSATYVESKQQIADMRLTAQRAMKKAVSPKPVRWQRLRPRV